MKRQIEENVENVTVLFNCIPKPWKGKNKFWQFESIKHKQVQDINLLTLKPRIGAFEVTTVAEGEEKIKTFVSFFDKKQEPCYWPSPHEVGQKIGRFQEELDAGGDPAVLAKKY